MILEVLRVAGRLDKKLEDTVGRPYRVFLSAALVVTIVHQIRDLIHEPESKGGVAQIAAGIVIGLLLLINQMGELSSRLERRSAGGRRRRRLASDKDEPLV